MIVTKVTEVEAGRASEGPGSVSDSGGRASEGAGRAVVGKERGERKTAQGQ